MKHQTVRIYKLITPLQNENLTPLEIGGRKISFMKPVLLNGCQFSKNEKGDWFLKFFSGKPYEQNLFVSQGKLNYNIAKRLTSASLIINSTDFSEKEAEVLSIAIRESKSIKKSDFIEYPSHYSHIDGRGLSFFSKIEQQEDNFYRQVLLLSLAYAYLGAIELITNKLSEKVNCDNCELDELTRIYIEVATFNSVFFFRQPVLSDKPSLTEIWKKIDECLKVDDSSNELLQQLTNVHYILNLDSEYKKEKQEQQKQEKQNRWNLAFAIIGILIGVIELLK